MRELLGPFLRFLLRPAALGAAYVAALVAIASGQTGDDASLGRDAHEFTLLVRDRFGDEVARIGVALVAAAVLLGLLLGAFSGLVVSLRDRLSRAPRRSPVRAAGSALGVTAFLHAWLVARGMATAPQLYAESWYAQGGVRRTVQVLITDVLGPRGVTILGAALLLLYVAGPPKRWHRWLPRLRRAVVPPRTKIGPPRRTNAPLILSALALFLLAVGLFPLSPIVPHARAASTAEHPNVLILAADSLRADRLTPRTAPNLSALAARGTKFERAYVSLPRTFPSWVTLLTGRHPHHHGIRSMFPRWEERTKDFDALPERLARAGYRTEVVSDYAGDIFTRIDLGFGRVETPTFDFRQLVRQRALERETPLLPVLHSRLGRAAFPAMREMNAAADPDMLADDAIRALGRNGESGAPFFLTVFFSTVHFPYAAPAPYYRRFTRASYRGRFKYHKPVGLGSEVPPDEDDIDQIRGLYDGAVASVDAACARVLASLEKAGLAQNTIVIVTADHGETLYEEGRGLGHGDHLFGDEGTHVPLLIIDPRRKAASVRGITRDVDIAPTLYALLGLEPPADVDGRSLVPAMDGGELAPVPAFAETGLWFTEDIPGLPSSMRLPYPGITRMTEIDERRGDEVVLQRAVRPLTIVAKHRMIKDDRFKLVYAPTRMGVKYMLFDSDADPSEARDVALEHPAELVRLKGELLAWMARDPDMRVSGDALVPRDLADLGASAPSAAVRLGAP